MNLIPVIDLLRGQVVRAVRGDRESYRPIVSTLCDGADPVTVAGVLCAHCDARQLYVADLDALLGGEPQLAVLGSLLLALPQTELWLDAAFTGRPAAEALRTRLGGDAGRVVCVFGSESLQSRTALERCFEPAGAAGVAVGVDADTDADAQRQDVLSLDRRDGRRLDAAGCWEAPALWPRRVIVMTLERVGSDAGPDLETLQGVRSKAPDRYIVGAGGIRDPADLQRAEAAGADAWLVASALHDGRLPRMQI